MGSGQSGFFLRLPLLLANERVLQLGSIRVNNFSIGFEGSEDQLKIIKMSSIQYKALDPRIHEIRLLVIKPLDLDHLVITNGDAAGHRKELLNITLETESLDGNPTYVALSYQWEPRHAPKGKQEILVDGIPVQIGSNLDSALHQIRQVDEPVRIWVDAICINQQDEVERSSQVQQMKLIYEKAASVLVWLGPAFDDVDLAIDTLDVLGRAADQAGILTLRRADFAIWNGPGPSDHLLSIRTALNELCDKTWLDLPHVALQKFSEREYWNRVWIVQEFVLPGKIDILCGSKRLSFESFAAGIIFLGYQKKRVGERTTSLDVIKSPALQLFLSTTINAASSVLVGLRRRYQSKEAGSAINLMTLLTQGCIVSSSSPECRHASLQRDKIFGLLALAADQASLRIKADYTQTDQQVYTDVTRALLKHGHLEILSWCQPPKSIPNLPSWVPDFSNPLRDPCCPSTIFSASGTTAATLLPPLPTHNPHALGLRGLILDTISLVGSHWAPGLDSYFNYFAAATLFRETKSLVERAYLLDPAKWPSTASLASAIWKLPCADQLAGAAPRTRATGASAPGALLGYTELVQFMELLPATFGAVVQSFAIQPYKMAMDYLHDRRPMVSNTGYVGMVPAGAKPGDVLCILYGASVPFVLRGREEKQGGYELVGEAYVFGVMDGEIITGGLKLAEEDFYIY